VLRYKADFDDGSDNDDDVDRCRPGSGWRNVVVEAGRRLECWRWSEVGGRGGVAGHARDVVLRRPLLRRTRPRPTLCPRLRQRGVHSTSPGNQHVRRSTVQTSGFFVRLSTTTACPRLSSKYGALCYWFNRPKQKLADALCGDQPFTVGFYGSKFSELIF